LKAEVGNSGSKAVEGSFVVRFYDGPPPPGAGNQIGTDQTIPDLCGCGGAEKVEVTWANVSPGAHEVYVVVDAKGTIPESNEDDNTGSGVILVATDRVFLPTITKAYSP
jgi:subtilase family serine protease